MSYKSAMSRCIS